MIRPHNRCFSGFLIKQHSIDRLILGQCGKTGEIIAVFQPSKAGMTRNHSELNILTGHRLVQEVLTSTEGKSVQNTL